MTMLGRTGVSWLRISGVTAGAWACITLRPLGGQRLLFLDWRAIFALFPILMLHKTQENNQLYLLLLNFVPPHFIDVESFFNFSHQLSRQACIKYFRCLQCWAGLLSLHPPEGMRSGLSQTLGNLALTAVSLLSGANRRASLQLQSILCLSRRSSNTPQHVCVCVWESCIPLGIWASIGEIRNVIFSLGKHTAGMCLCMHVSDCTFGRAICHPAGGWSGKSIDCKLTGEVLSDTNHLYMRWHTRLQRRCV